jgi:hypothetical protein
VPGTEPDLLVNSNQGPSIYQKEKKQKTGIFSIKMSVQCSRLSLGVVGLVHVSARSG